MKDYLKRCVKCGCPGAMPLLMEVICPYRGCDNYDHNRLEFDGSTRTINGVDATLVFAWIAAQEDLGTD